MVIPNSDDKDKIAKEAIDAGDPSVMTALASMYERGVIEGGRPDYGLAQTLYLEAIRLKYAPAMVGLALMYRKRLIIGGTQFGDSEAITLLKIASDLGDASAMYNLALRYDQGLQGQATPVKGVNFAQVTYLYKRVIDADAENASAMHNLARLYKKGSQGIPPKYPEAIELYNRAIKLGHVPAIVGLAQMYQGGLGTKNGKPNYPEAIKLYNRAIKLGDVPAIVGLAQMYEEGWGTQDGKPNFSKAIELYERAIRLGNASAMARLAKMYEEGRGTQDGEPNYPMAMALYKQAAEEGDASAIKYSKDIETPYKQAIAADKNKAASDMAKLAQMYQQGQGTKDGKPNYPMAMALYRLAIEEGHTSDVTSVVMTDLAQMYLKGLGTKDGKPNYREAHRLFSKASALGNISATAGLASMYQQYTEMGFADFHSMLFDYYSQAITLYEQAIKKGNTSAMAGLASMYQEGLGMKNNAPDYPKAIELYKQAIDLGDTSAMVGLASMYQQGLGMEKDYPKAIELYKQAIDLGDTSAMANLAQMYQQGLGTENSAPDYSRAMNLYEKMVAAGTPFSKCYFNWMPEHSGGQERLEQLLVEIADISLKNIKTAEDLFNGIRNAAKSEPVKNNPYVLIVIDRFSSDPEVLKKIKKYSQDEVGLSKFVKRYFSEFIGNLIHGLAYRSPILGWWGDYLRNQTIQKFVTEELTQIEGKLAQEKNAKPAK